MPDVRNSQPSLLIVDDSPENLRVMGELLKPLYRVRVANSGEKALRIAMAQPQPDMVILDVMMPEMDGYEVMRRLHADPSTRDIPVIFVTAREGTDDEEFGLTLGAVDYIAKPIRPAIVLSRVRTQLELKASRDILKDKNAWLEHEVSLRMRENTLVNKLAIRALAGVAEIRDSSTGEHILRTETYVRILAAELAAQERFRDELSPTRIEYIGNASVLHDIGKVGISDNILCKPGPLTPEEYEVMKTHTTLGANAIDLAITATLGQLSAAQADDKEIRERAVTLTRQAMEIALSHHEKWDGSGYPAGLAGEEIPLSGRLMAVADVFDALTTDRVYKRAMRFEDAAAIIEKGRGTHFDPAMVDAFIACKDRFRSVVESGARQRARG